jgi:hypothetical protein
MSEEILIKEEDVNFLKLILAANDDKFEMWSQSAVEYARRICNKNWQRVPSLDAAVKELGLDLSKLIYAEIKKDRDFFNALIGHKSPCHYCGSDSDLGGFYFALMKVETSNRSWGGTLASVALSAITVPLIGGAALSLPGKSLQGGAFRLKLVACKACMNKNSNLIGLFLPNEERASHHPLWKPLQDAGFTKLFLHEKIPSGLRSESDL